MISKSDKKLLAILLSAIVGSITFLSIIFFITSDRKTVPRKEYTPSLAKKISVIDFSNMKHDDIHKWCNENNVICKNILVYSDSIPKEGFVSQSVKHREEIEENGTIYIMYSRGKTPTIAQQNALKQAESYLNHSSFSREGLINQLVYEEYSKEDAIYAVDNVSVDWNEQAVKKAKSYLSHSAFSRNRLIKQLEYEKFTKSQAEYGVNKAGL